MKSFVKTLKEKGRKLVTIIDPHIKAKESYDVQKKLKENGNISTKLNLLNKLLDCLVLNKEKELFLGHCWPGDSYWADFINPKTESVYKEFFKNEEYFFESDNIHTWNDMNEPAVFNQFEHTMPKSNM
jgi:alpha 1,3-glucosidase